MKQPFRRALFHDLSALHKHHAVGHVAGKAHFVRDDHHGHALSGEIAHHGKNLLRKLGIKRAGGLVKAKNFRLHAQRAGDGHALRLAAGELIGVLGFLAGQADLGKQRARLFNRLRL